MQVGRNLPEFVEDGVLPPGDYPMTLEQLRECWLVSGPGLAHPTWDSEWRRRLVDNLAVLVGQIWKVGIEEIYICGSFAEDKDHPNDIDGYCVCDLHHLASGKLERDLNLIDPHKVWTWDPAARSELDFPSAFRLSRRDGRSRGIVKIIKGGQS